MGLHDALDSDKQRSTDTDESPSKTQIVFWNLPETQGYEGREVEPVEQAYHLSKGNGQLRNIFDGLHIDDEHSWSDIHAFTAELLVNVQKILQDDDYSGMFDQLMVDGESIADYLQNHPEVMEEVEEALQASEGEEEAAEADD